MIKKSIFFKFFFSIFAFILLILLFFFKISSDQIKHIYIENGYNELHKICFSLYDTFKRPLLKKHYKEIDQLCKRYGKMLGVRITVIAKDGTVLGDSYKDPEKMENHINRAEIKGAIKKGEAHSLRYSTTMDCYLIYNAVKISDYKKELGFLRVSMFLKAINSEVDKVKKRIKEVLFFMLIASLIVSIALSKTLSMPIEEIADKVSSIAKGNFKVRLSMLKKGELGLLAKNINEMAEKIEALFEELRKEKDILRRIINSIPVAIFVISVDGEILMANDAFKDIVHEDNVEGRLYWELLREPELNLFIQQFRKTLMDMQKEITIGKDPFLCSIKYLEEEKEAIVVLHNIAILKETDRIKKDLVANVSHELRTPLTVIKGYVETLIEIEDEEEKKKYLEIIERNINRMLSMIKDLLFLSELDTKAGLTVEEIDIEKLINEVHKIFLPRLKEKRLYFKVDVDPCSKIIYADRTKLEHALINLIDNAVKYTEKGGVSIRVLKENDFVNIEVSDTGIGIPEDHIPYIFERFYVVDKSRSRKKGGTGLGLSIVKHIVELHKGKIFVKSTPKKGTTFTISLPAKA